MEDKYKNYIFDFEKLDVYKRSLDLANEIFPITFGFRGELKYSLGDQLRRSALSICNNLAEGCAKSLKARRQFFNYSLYSARECIPMLTLALNQKQISREKERALRCACIHICNMLYNLIRSTITHDT